MGWNAAPEIIASIVILIMIINSSGSWTVPTPRNRMFLMSLWFTFSCIVLNIASVYTIQAASMLPLWVNLVVNTAFFVVYPFMPILFIAYLLLFMFERSPIEHRKRLMVSLYTMVATVTVYLLIAAGNLWTGWLFSFDKAMSYVRGPLNTAPMLLAVLHIIIAVIQLYFERRHLDKFFLRTVSYFPLIIIGILAVQILYPNIVLTGTAMMIATLTVYLNFQVKKISEDNLTKLPNRETFSKMLQIHSRKNKQFTILLVSLDDFKFVNDTYGQHKGDLLLLAVSNGLSTLFPGEQLYRYGGDEFAMVLPGIDGNKSSAIVASVLARFARPWDAEGIQVRIGASVAVLSLPLETEEPMDPVNLLDHAIRTAKNRGKGQSIICNQETLTAMRRRNRLIERLRSGIDKGLFSLQYQPIYNLHDGSMVNAEALLRLEDPVLGSTGPAEFIPIAEEIGLIEDIGQWVFLQVCRFLEKIQQSDLTLPAIAVNLSVRQLTDEHLAKRLLDTMDLYNIPGTLIKLEITESAFIGYSYQQVLSVMEPLISRGISFHLDDFGTGYSNLAYVINLPFSGIKLDKTLVWDITNNPRMQSFVEKLIRAVSHMGAQVIVEGIETEQQLAFLRQVGCDMVQGFYFSPPLDAEDFIASLAKNRPLPLTNGGPLG